MSFDCRTASMYRHHILYNRFSFFNLQDENKEKPWTNLSQEIALHTAICHDEKWVQTTGIDLDKKRKKVILVALAIVALGAALVASGVGIIGMSAIPAAFMICCGAQFGLSGFFSGMAEAFEPITSNKALHKRAQRVNEIWLELQNCQSDEKVKLFMKANGASTERLYEYDALLHSTQVTVTQKERLFVIAQDMVAHKFAMGEKEVVYVGMPVNNE